MIIFDANRTDPKRCKRIVNPKQCAAYMKHGVRPIDLYVGYDDALVFVFDEDATKELYQKWLRHEL